MAITSFNPNTLTGTIRNDLGQSPYGAFPASSNTIQQYGIHNLPDRLRGMDIERSLKTVNYMVSDMLYQQQGNDLQFRDHIKHKLSSLLAEEAYKVAKFTQIRDPHTYDIKVIGRVVMMTEDQLIKLIRAAR